MVVKILFSICCSFIFTQHFQVDLNSTGVFDIVIFQDTIEGIDIGDEIGIFDASGVSESCIPEEGCNTDNILYVETLVGAGVWDGIPDGSPNDQGVSAITSINVFISQDYSGFNGPILNGAVQGNPIVIKVYDSSEGIEVSTSPTFIAGGDHGYSLSVVSDLGLGEDPDPILGCTDVNACNFNIDATEDDNSCEYAQGNYDCDGNCLINEDCFGECGGDAIEDCNGICNGSASEDECGVCEGDGSSCEVYIELEVTTVLDAPIDDDYELELFQNDFESYMENELGLPSGTVEVLSITFIEVREYQVIIEFAVVLTEEELEQTDFQLDTIQDDITTSVVDIEEEIDEGLPDFVAGCTDTSADNYSPDANIDNGSCEYSVQLPDSFLFNQTTQQAFYFIENANIEGEPLEIGVDYIGAFNGDKCVGYRLWDGSNTDIPAMGDDGSEDGEGYMTSGVMPKFKIFDASENFIYDTTIESSMDLAWAQNEFFFVTTLNGLLEITVSYSIPLRAGANLISFHALPEDVSVGYVLSSLGTSVTGVIGDGVAAVPIGGSWLGSLTQTGFLRTSGYWLKLNQIDTLHLASAIPTDPGIEYLVERGANLLSFPDPGQVSIAGGLPDNVEPFITGIIGDGVAAVPIGGSWLGSLTENGFQGTKGYWFKSSSNDPIYFSYNVFDQLDRSNKSEIIDLPYNYTQSSQQAFYFIDDVDFNIKKGDWILAYNDNVVVGSRQWNGLYTDIPVMGYDNSAYSIGYCNDGDLPEFVWIDDNGISHSLISNASAWSNNEINYITLSYSESSLPNQYNLIKNYPNPFNPSTTISFSLAQGGDVTLNIYDISGRLVVRLLDQNLESGQHRVNWSGIDSYGEKVSAGMYMYSLQTKGTTISNKMILMK